MNCDQVSKQITTVRRRSCVKFGSALFITLGVLQATVYAEPLSLQLLVTPSSVIQKDGHPITFALHGFIEFKSLAGLFPYIESQSQRWKSNAEFDEATRSRFRRELLRRGIESRVISMEDERPLETLITHTRRSSTTIPTSVVPMPLSFGLRWERV